MKIRDVPPKVTQVDPSSEAWLRADRPVEIEWDPQLINATQVRIDVLAYSEVDTPTWIEIGEVFKK